MSDGPQGLSEDPREVEKLAVLGVALVARLGQSIEHQPAEPLTFTVTAAAEKLGVSSGFFKHQVLPELRVVRLGSRVMVPLREIEQWIDRRSARTVER